MKKNAKSKIISLLIGFTILCIFIGYAIADDTFLDENIVITGYSSGNFWHCWPCDLDEDGDIDVIGSSSTGISGGGKRGFLSWSENNGDGSSWTTHFVDDDQCGPVWAETADMDDDGDIDVLCAARTISGVCSADHILFYENDGSESFTMHYVKQGGYGASYVVHTADFDDDGDLDCCGISPYGHRCDWFENTGNMDSWTQHTVDVDSGKGHRGLAIGDIDDDGYIDIIIGEGQGNKDLFWCENNGTGGGWSQTQIDSTLDAPNTICTGDIDNDGDLDVLSGSYNIDGGFAWFNNTAGDGSSWTKHVVKDSGAGFRGCNVTDLDEDGDMDLLITFLNDDELFWYENDGSESFTEHLINSSFGAACAIYPADINGDSVLDVIGASDIAETWGKVSWWEQDYTPSINIEILSINGLENESIIRDSTPTINWTRISDTSQYWLQIDNNVDFSSPEVNLTDINQWTYPSYFSQNSTRVSFTLPTILTSYDKYYMRVRALIKN